MARTGRERNNRRVIHGALWGLALVVAATGCERRPGPATFVVVQKGPYQALYRADGTLERILLDRNDDRRADVIVFYDSAGKPLRSEIDSDNDGRIDRWEVFLHAGLWLEESDRNGDGRPDEQMLHGPGDVTMPLTGAPR
jgi:hypothetical protein